MIRVSTRHGVVALLVLTVSYASYGQVDSGVSESALETLFLTWEADPTTTMTFVWLSTQSREQPLIRWAPDGGGIPRGGWREARGTREAFGPSVFHVCRVSLRSLQPDTVYRFLVPGSVRELRFRTVPADSDAAYSFVSGGDAGPWQMTTRIGRHAAGHDPLFAVLGGDLAYSDGQHPENWIAFLARWHESMVTAGGRVIPLLVCIGNHEVNIAMPPSRAAAPYFYSLFGLFRSQRYASLDFGKSMSFLFLDSGHTGPIAGDQTAWLERRLAAREDVPHLFVVYHIPAYPSYREFDATVSEQLRREWVPLFERNGVDVVFENHDHTYKRSPLIRAGKRAPNGVLYLGDGSWGTYARIAKRAEEHWYLDATRSTNHFLLTNIAGNARRHRAFDDKGILFDSYPQPQVTLELVTAPNSELGLSVYDQSSSVEIKVTATAPRVPGKKVVGVTGKVYLETAMTRRRHGGSFTVGTTTVVLSDLPVGRVRLSIRGTVNFEKHRPEPFAWMDKMSFRVLDYAPRKASPVSGLSPGLRYRVYLNNFTRLDFRGLAPAAAGVARSVGLQPAGALVEYFGIVFDGFVRIDETGLHRFSSTSDDGSRVFIGEALVVDGDGRHPSIERSGVIALEKGLHPLRIEYFQYTLDRTLQVRIASDGVVPRPLAPETLFHSGD